MKYYVFFLFHGSPLPLCLFNLFVLHLFVLSPYPALLKVLLSEDALVSPQVSGLPIPLPLPKLRHNLTLNTDSRLKQADFAIYSKIIPGGGENGGSTPHTMTVQN